MAFAGRLGLKEIEQNILKGQIGLLPYAPQKTDEVRLRSTMPVGPGLPLIVRIEDEMLRQCTAFAHKMKAKIQGHEWNDIRTGGRSVDEKFENILGGKIAECAVHGLLASKGVTMTPPDFTIIGDNARDDGDLRTANGVEISVKATVKGRYLAVHTGNLSWKIDDVYIFCRVEKTMERFTGGVTILAGAGEKNLFPRSSKRGIQ